MQEKSPSEVTVGYECRTRIDGEWTPIEYSRNFTVTAPVKVAPKEVFNVTFDSAPIYAFPQFNRRVTDLEVAYRVSANAEVLEYKLAGGSNLGDAKFWVERRGTDLVVKSNGTFQGGVEFDVPNLVVTLRAPDSGTVTTAPGGSSFEEASFGWVREQTQTGQWDPFQCYADPQEEPVKFTTTTVG